MSNTGETSPAAGAVDVREFVDSAPFSRYQKLLLALCFLTTFFDGFDTQAIAVAGPWIRDEMSLQPAQLGSVFAAGSLGGIVAAFAMAPFADKIGRRPLIVGAMLIAGILSLCYTFAETFTQLLALRFSAGICLAIAVTVTYAYSAELAPKRAAATAVMVTSAGFGLG
ncbi:MAG TPA: MFS transporter, partial [Caulobacteraceae bacterium]|nr:MFS transporter [Caulobacteraceae bacterium]